MEIMTRVPAPIRRIGRIGAVALAAVLAVPLLAMATPANAATAAAVTASATDVTSTASTVLLGQPVSFHAFVDPADGGGTVTFTSNGVTIPGCAGLPFLSGGAADWETACTTSSLPGGSDTITATYSGDAAFAGSSGSVTENVSLPATSTILTASPVYYHAPATLTAQVSGGDGGGTVSFHFLAGVVCNSVPLVDYTATCTVPWPMDAEPAALAMAYYSGDSASGSSGDSVGMTPPGPSPTSTSLSLSSPGAVYGQEQSEQASVTVSADSGLTPDGTVEVISTLSGRPVCTTGLVSGSGACTLPPTAVPADVTSLVAYYNNGSTDFIPSSSNPQTLTVARAATTTALSLSPAGIVYGAEQAEQVSATVTSPAGTPDGTVTVTSGTTTVCTITLAAGTGTCTLAAAQFPASTDQFIGTYNGSASFTGSASAAQTLTVAKATTTTVLSLSAATVTHGQEQAEHLTASVAPQYGGTPDGTVTVKAGTTKVCTIALASGTGTCTLGAAKLPAGTYTLTATYAASSNYTSSTSAGQALTVAA